MGNMYIHTGTEKFVPFEKRPILKKWRNKPPYGLWGCLYTSNEAYVSAWEAFKAIEHYGRPSQSCFFLFQLKPEARILTINSVADYIAIPDKLKNNEYGTLDWDAVAVQYDAVEVTKSHGYWVSLGFGAPGFSLESWDVPSIVVLNSDVVIPKKR